MNLDPGLRQDDGACGFLNPNIQKGAGAQHPLRRFGGQSRRYPMHRRGLRAGLGGGWLSLAHRGLEEGPLRRALGRALRRLQRALAGQVRAQGIHGASGATMVNGPLQARGAASRIG